MSLDGPRKPLPRQSARARAKAAARRRVVEQTQARAGGRCEAALLVPDVACWGPLDTDEKVRRSRRKDAELDVENTQLLCRAHHDWKELHRVEAARLGLCPFPYWYHGEDRP